MSKGMIATARVTIAAHPQTVWNALTDPAIIKKYMFGSEVRSDWSVGSTILYAGEYEGKKYEDHGEILEMRPPERLRTTHFSPLSGKPDVPENYHEIAYTLELTQDNNANEAEAEHSAANWQQMLDSLKSVVESTP